MENILLIMMLAVTVEALVEYGKMLGRAVTTKDYHGLAAMVSALIVSVLLCFATGADFYTELGVQFTYPWVGVLLTGIFASRGANFVNDLIQKLRGAKPE